MDEEPDWVHLLGLSERAARRGLGWDLIGVSRTLGFPFFPAPMSGLSVVLSVEDDRFLTAVTEGIRLVATDDSRPTEQATIELTGEVSTSGLLPAGTTVPLPGFREMPAVVAGAEGVELATGLRVSGQGGREMIVLPCPPLTLLGPGHVSLALESGSDQIQLGTVALGWSTPKPITPDERRALMTRPSATAGVVLTIACKSCSDRFVAGASLDPDDPMEDAVKAHGAHFKRLPTPQERWSCRCSKVDFPLTYLNHGLHDLLRRPASAGTPLTSFSPLYERSRLDGIISDFAKLIERSPGEEEVQKFIEDTPLVWGFLRPTRILHKPPILTQYRADFAVLSAERVLHLIEIEKPSTRLLTKAGGLASEIQKGADQVRDWAAVIDLERTASIREMGLDPETIADVRYVLVGGRTKDLSATGANKLRRDIFGNRVRFLSYDDLVSFLGAVKAGLPSV